MAVVNRFRYLTLQLVVLAVFIKFIIKEPFWNGSSESIQVFNTAVSCPCSLLCTRLLRSPTLQMYKLKIGVKRIQHILKITVKHILIRANIIKQFRSKKYRNSACFVSSKILHFIILIVLSFAYQLSQLLFIFQRSCTWQWRVADALFALTWK